MTFKDTIRQFHSTNFLKTWKVLCIDVIASVLSSLFVVAIINLLNEFKILDTAEAFYWLLCSAVVSTGVFRIGRAYTTVIRYSTLREVAELFSVCFYKDVLLWVILSVFPIVQMPIGLITAMVIIDFFVTISALILVRVMMILMYDKMKLASGKENESNRILVYGTSDKAVSTIPRLRHSPHFKTVGFITFGEKVANHHLVGKSVYYFKDKKDVVSALERASAEGILFPYVTDARVEQDRLLEICKDSGIKTYITPGIDELAEGKNVGTYVRKIKIEDLLGRDEIKISMEEIIKNFRGKTVMVTGAAGSIGSELCRQLATFEVKNLILFDNAETPLHNIRLELEDGFPNLNFEPIIGDVRSINRLEYVFSKYKPQIVFHAAAYKHVPLMEENPCEAVRVNVTGSRQVADMCVKHGVEKMVMVSTDKAVNPTNIMGCTKRLAEIYVQSLGAAIERGDIKGVTKFVTTRFGNVLGSNGSVIPRFHEQIEHGGPITVTHPEITRFFMTIPEACRLVMEAATFATGTQIFVFDMGKSVKIVTLAERMIELSGLKVGEDIKIEFTGLRPGEKLYEEVLATKENTLPTSHDRIFIAKAREYPYVDALKINDKLTELANRVVIPEMVTLMKVSVPEFKSKNSEFEQFDN